MVPLIPVNLSIYPCIYDSFVVLFWSSVLKGIQIHGYIPQELYLLLL